MVDFLQGYIGGVAASAAFHREKPRLVGFVGAQLQEI
jgi:hypothetical protein